MLIHLALLCGVSDVEPAEEVMKPVHLQQPLICGPWEQKERLGTGGFGNVTRWQNKVQDSSVTVTVVVKQL